MNGIGQYIESLFKASGQRQSDIARSIGVPRQLLSYVATGKRELSMPLALKLESFFNLPEGKLLKMQAEESVHKYKQKLRGELVGELFKVNAFWSYADVSAADIPDEELIEKVLVYKAVRALPQRIYPQGLAGKDGRSGRLSFQSERDDSALLFRHTTAGKVSQARRA